MKTASPKPKQSLPRNAFIGKAEQPTDADLAVALGDAKPVWDRLVSALIADCPELVPEWKFYSLKMGWAFRLQHKKRNIIHFGPCTGSFQVLLILGDRTVRALHAASVPERLRELLATAPKYPEGTGIRFLRVKQRDLPAIRQLAKMKIEN
jgi:Protein of unknown function (DUF3788)